MNGLGQIIAMNARAAGKEALAFTVYVTVDPKVMQQIQQDGDDRTITEIVSDEIESNLDSVPYVESVTIKPRRDP